MTAICREKCVLQRFCRISSWIYAGSAVRLATVANEVSSIFSGRPRTSLVPASYFTCFRCRSFLPDERLAFSNDTSLLASVSSWCYPATCRVLAVGRFVSALHLFIPSFFPEFVIYCAVHSIEVIFNWSLLNWVNFAFFEISYTSRGH